MECSGDSGEGARRIGSADSEKKYGSSSDAEEAHVSVREGESGEGFRGKHDPFGNERGAQCQYKTMVWW